MLVGAHHLHALGGQHLEHLGVRMAVTVLLSHADQPDPGAHGPQERLLAGAGAVVGHGERLGPEPLGMLEQVALGGMLDVAGQQQPTVGPPHPDHDRAVVELAAGEAVGPARRRREHLEVQVADAGVLAGNRRTNLDAAGVGLGEQVADGVEVVGHRPVPHLSHIDRP